MRVSGNEKGTSKKATVPKSLQDWVYLEKKEGTITKYRFFPYRPAIVTLMGYVFTGMLPAIFAIIILVMSGLYGFSETSSPWLGTVFLVVSLFLAFLLHKYVVVPAKPALKPYVYIEIHPDEIIVKQIFPDVARKSTIRIPKEKIRDIVLKEEKSIGYRVGIKVDPQVFARANNTVYLGSYGTKQNGREMQKFLQSLIGFKK